MKHLFTIDIRLHFGIPLQNAVYIKHAYDASFIFNGGFISDDPEN
jgi:hypothetical protein